MHLFLLLQTKAMGYRKESMLLSNKLLKRMDVTNIKIRIVKP